jgi:ribokinase
MKALTIGGAMIDTIAVIADEHIERMAMRNADASFLLLEEGKKNEAEEISTHCGGGAINAAVALARLGFDVATIVKLGKDSRAETILARLAAEGISTRFTARDGRAPTGASVLISAHDRNAAIFTARGANTLLDSADLKADAFAADLVYVSSLSNDSANCFPDIVALAKSNGALMAANPGIRQLSARQSQFRASIGGIGILALNAHEAAALVPWLITLGREGGAPLKSSTGHAPKLAKRGLSASGFDLSLALFFETIHKLGPLYVVITDGRDGAYASSAAGIVHCPAIPLTAAGTAGAGDAFSSTFSASIARGAAVDAALCHAAANAASVVTYLDTQTGLLGASELNARVAELADILKVSRLQ